MDGMVLLDKPSGVTSRQALGMVKRKLGLKKGGFLGTLDPLATGLLVCFFGEATKLIRHFEGADKMYEVTFELGKSSDTFDCTGKVEQVSELWKRLTQVELEQAILLQTGEHWQTQPRFSAIRRHGKRSYELARAGVDFALGKRQVNILEATLLSCDFPVVRVRMICSSGTYVRAWVHELGERLGCGAVMTALRRSGVGLWRLDQSVSVEDVGHGHLLDSGEIRRRYLAHVR